MLFVCIYLSAFLHFCERNNTIVVMNDAPELNAYNMPGSGERLFHLHDLEPTPVDDMKAKSFMGGKHVLISCLS